MDRNQVVKLKKIINTTELSGEKVTIDFDSGKYYLIKGVGNDIWEMIQQEISVDQIVANLLKEYDVTEEECEKSVIEFLDKLAEMGWI